ncbi:MAG: ABC transporter permease [Muribaculaceae bacterium]|nr:ABC transporter permease [Muribaculaceae bacterium]
MSKIGIIIEREYLERVRKKSFILTTILMPLFMLGMTLLPVLIMEYGGTSGSTVLVVDNSGIVGPKLTDTDDVKFILASQDVTQDSAMRAEGHDILLVIPSGIVEAKRTNLKVFSDGPTSMVTETTMANQINKIIENERLSHYDIDNLDKILQEVKSDVSINTIRLDKDSEEALSSGLSYGIGIGMSFVLYMFLIIYGQMVMTSIIEEKSNRVLEVVVTSVKPMQLMLGKIIGVALVAVTQMVLWGILLSAISGILLPSLMPAETMADVAAIQSGNMNAVNNPDSIEITQALASLTQVNEIVSLVALMTLFLVLGFLVYSSIFAAIGSAVDNIQDASQLSSFAVFPILFGMMFGMVAAMDPSGTVAFWASVFPLTSPMVMVARIPFGIPGWEIVLSIVLLIVSFLFFVWMAGKIYRVGIFMYGKKPSVKEIIKWTRYK